MPVSIARMFISRARVRREGVGIAQRTRGVSQRSGNRSAPRTELGRSDTWICHALAALADCRTRLGTALGYAISGVLLCIAIIGIPFGVQSFKFVPLALFPFGKEIVSANDLRDDIGIARASA